jgi:serine/threonine-protein kinase
VVSSRSGSSTSSSDGLGLDLEASRARAPLDVTEAVELTIQACERVAAGAPSGLGAIRYRAPEQLRSANDGDARADVWSLGVVLFELITGHLPFGATDEAGVRAQIADEPHRTVRSLQPDTPMGVEEIIDHCLLKDPAQRYPSPADLAAALLPFAPKRARVVVERANALMLRASGRPPAVTAEAKGVPVIIGLPARSPGSRAPAPNSTLVWIAIAAVILGLSGGVFALVTRFVAAPRAAPAPADGEAKPSSVAAP